MSVRIREVENITILDIDGPIDINSSEVVETVGWLVNTGKLNLIMNLENVDLVDYSGLSILAIAYKNVLNHKGKMKFIRVPLQVIELLKIVRLDSVFPVYPDEESAIKSFGEADEPEKSHLRRKFTRLDIHLGVKYKIAGSQKRPKIFDGRVLNISAAGLYVYSPYTFPINTMLDLEFDLPNEPSTLEATGVVAWLADKELQSHSYPGMGVAFVHLTSEKERAIIGFIEKNITHRSEPT
jgi:anti-sigma B factor antagonist